MRKYDEEIGRFTSTDPLWEKYYSWTPYHYCSNNPVMGSDPGGMEVWITYKEEVTEDDGSENTVDKKVQYKNGKLYNEDGKAYKGNNEFVQSAYDVLRRFSNSNSSVYRSRMKELVNSEFVFSINQSTAVFSDLVNEAHPEDQYEFRDYGTPMGGVLNINLKTYGTDANDTKMTLDEYLSHEVLGHFYDYMKGNNDYNVDPGEHVPNNDIRAINIQNYQRIMEGKGLRKTYGGFEISNSRINPIMEK